MSAEAEEKVESVDFESETKGDHLFSKVIIKSDDYLNIFCFQVKNRGIEGINDFSKGIMIL